MTRILIIDDSPEDREWLGEMAQEISDATVYAFEDSTAGLDHFYRHGADCVVLDYRLHKGDGLATLASLKSSAMFVPVILTTGQGNEELAKTAIKAGACDYVPKQGLTAGKLADSILAAIQKERDEKKSAGADTTLKRVLLIEDNDDDRADIAGMILSANGGVSVSAIATGEEALSDFEEHGADCVILDYRLEAEDGLDVLAALKQRSPFTPVIMLTGQGNEDVAARSIKVGAADYLVKQRLNETYLRTSIENAISRAALEAKVADQEQQRRQFLNILVHDLRAPLRNVRQLGEMATEEFEGGDLTQAKDLLSSQAEVASRANALISTLETFALLDAEVRLSTLALSEAANAARDNLATDIFDRQAIVEIGRLPQIRGHMPQLVQLFQNLIGNGLKYNESLCPRISVEAAGGTTNGTIIVVRDNGIGIPEEHLDKIFQPLKRLWNSSEYEGTGLGLAICQKIVDRHKGRIWCKSEEGEGSRFFVRFPRTA